MSLYITGLSMPEDDGLLSINIWPNGNVTIAKDLECKPVAKAVELPPHGDLIDRDALIKDGWLNLHKEVMRMGGYAIHELPLKNPSIPVVVPAERRDADA